jgi:hypothetical protein
MCTFKLYANQLSWQLLPYFLLVEVEINVNKGKTAFEIFFITSTARPRTSKICSRNATLAASAKGLLWMVAPVWLVWRGGNSSIGGVSKWVTLSTQSSGRKPGYAFFALEKLGLWTLNKYKNSSLNKNCRILQDAV